MTQAPPKNPPPPAPSQPDYQTDALALYHALRLRAETDPPLHTALRVLEGAVRLYTPSNLAVAFNGGKDATVVTHLARAVVAHASPRAPLHCLYLLGGSGASGDFPEVEAFVRSQVDACGLDAVEVDAGFKDGIRMFTARREGRCAFVLGTRRDDPHGKDMEHFEPSSPGWPPFMRVNPILTWNYRDVWQFLKDFRLPYCAMYDRGYTSIGSMDTTLPNPALRLVAEDGSVSYRPAWQLEDVSLERAGRLPKLRPADQANHAETNGQSTNT